MSPQATMERPAVVRPSVSSRRRVMNIPLKGTIEDARRQAAMVLEVLAGVATTTEAAKALSLSLVSYYKLEARALRGLVMGCQPPGRGPRSSPEVEVQRLRKQCRRLQQEVGRYQALVRVTQRAAGLNTVPPAAVKDARGRRKRKPSVRALKAAQTLRNAPAEAAPAQPPASVLVGSAAS